MYKNNYIYCSECGMNNSAKNEKCKYCFSDLNKKDLLYKDYLAKYIKDEYNCFASDKTSKLLKYFIMSHPYGFTISALTICAIVIVAIKAIYKV